MKFALFTAAFAAVAGLVQGASSSAKASSMSTTTMSNENYNPQAPYICINYAFSIPACGTTALLSLASKIGGCGPVDFACQCKYSAAVQAVASSPIIANCGLNTALSVQGAADQLCSCMSANNAPIGPNATASGQAAKTGAAAPGIGRAAPTDPTAVFMSLGGAIAAVAGVVAAL